MSGIDGEVGGGRRPKARIKRVSGRTKRKVFLPGAFYLRIGRLLLLPFSYKIDDGE